MLLFTLPIAIVIGLLVSRYYHPETKTKKILASILIPLISGVIIHLLVASCKNSGYGFAFDLGSTLAFVAIPEIALLVTLFITLKTLKTEKKETPTVEKRNEDKPDAIGTEMQESNEEPEKMESTKLAEEKPERKDGMSKTIKVLLLTILSLVLLTAIGFLASLVYTKYIYPKQAKADDKALLETVNNNPVKGYEIAQVLLDREINGHCSGYHGPITGWQGKCDFDHAKAGKEAAERYCQYCIDSAKIDYSKSADIAVEMLFNKNDGYCYDLYNKAGVEIIINGAEQGDNVAQNYLGCYYFGIDITNKNGDWDEYHTFDGKDTDYAKAAFWFLQAANQGNTKAMGNLGECYMRGDGVNKDEKKGLEWIQKAADLEDAFCQCRLGDFYRDGVRMVVGSHKETHKSTNGGYFEKGEKIRGYYDNKLGEWVDIYQEEVPDYKTILPKDMEQAQYWWKRAAENGSETAKERLQQIFE